MERVTAENQRLGLWVAFDYGGRDELVRVARGLIESGVAADAVDEQVFRAHLYAPSMPDPDLVIRTSGELRLSNFLLWQSAYAELHFTSALWPDFGEEDLREALEAYASAAGGTDADELARLAHRVWRAAGAVALYAVWVGGWLMTGLGVVGVIAMHEYCAMTKELRPLTVAGFAGAAGIIAVHRGGLVWGLAVLLAALVLAFWLSAVADVRQRATVQLATTLFGITWIGYGIGFLIALRDIPGSGNSGAPCCSPSCWGSGRRTSSPTSVGG